MHEKSVREVSLIHCQARRKFNRTIVVSDTAAYGDAMKSSLPLKELATAIGLSDISGERWEAEGRPWLEDGAHGKRDVAMTEAIRFIREHRYKVVSPQALGLAELPGGVGFTPELPGELLLDVLLREDPVPAATLLFRAFLDGMSIAEICDGPVKHAMNAVGELWLKGPEGILIEHRATDVCLQSISLLRSSIAHPASGGPLAIGCALEGDPHMLTSIAAAAALTERGVQALNLGAETPWSVLSGAAKRYLPRLVWISVSTRRGPELATRLAAFADEVVEAGAHVIVGGCDVKAGEVPSRPNLRWGSSLGELCEFASRVQ